MNEKASNNERLLRVLQLIQNHPGITRDELLRTLLVEQDGRYAVNPDTLSSILSALCNEGFVYCVKERRGDERSPLNHYQEVQDLENDLVLKLVNAICCSVLLADADKQKLVRFLQSRYHTHALAGSGYAYVGSEQVEDQVQKSLLEAIAMERRVSLSLCGWDRNMRLIDQRRIMVDPYALVYYENRSYLYCSEEGQLSFLRLDRVMDVHIEEEVSENSSGRSVFREETLYSSTEKIPGHLGRFLKAHFGAKPVYVRMIVNSMDVQAAIYSDMKDIFEEWIVNEDGTLCVDTTESTAIEFALSHSEEVEILKPVELRNRIITILKNSVQRYGKE